MTIRVAWLADIARISSQWTGDQTRELHLDTRTRELCDMRVLDFCRSPHTRSEIQEMLGEATDCPPELLLALFNSISSELLSDHYLVKCYFPLYGQCGTAGRRYRSTNRGMQRLHCWTERKWD